MKKIVSFIIAMVFVLSIPTATHAAMQYTPSVELSSDSIYLVDENGLVLYEKNATQRMYPLELNQIMTAIITIEHIEEVGGWEATATYNMSTQNYLYDHRNEVVLSGMLSGYTFTADELFHALIIASGYDAAITLSKLIAGSQEAFVELMNEKAADIGAKDTNFTNCTGLHDTANYTTAYDMYLISKYAMGLDKFHETVAKKTFTCAANDSHKELIWNSNNSLLFSGNIHYYSPVKGIKVGFNKEIGRNIVSYAENEDFSYFQICLGAPYELDNGYNRAMVDTKNLYMWAFTEFEIKTLVEKGAQVAEVPLELAWQKDTLKLSVGETFKTLLPIDIDTSSISYEYDIPESVEAPITEGEKIGSLNLLLAGEKIGSIPLVATESVEQSDLLSGLKGLSDLTHSFWFKLIIVFIIVVILLYTTIMVIRNYNQRKYSRRRKHY